MKKKDKFENLDAFLSVDFSLQLCALAGNLPDFLTESFPQLLWKRSVENCLFPRLNVVI